MFIAILLKEQMSQEHLTTCPEMLKTHYFFKYIRMYNSLSLEIVNASFDNFKINV